MPRIGKTSIAKEVLRILRNLDSNQRLGYISLDAVRGPVNAYKKILRSLDCDLPAKLSEIECHDDVYEAFLYRLRKNRKEYGWSILVIDEFDAIARSEFDDAWLFISRLREIANDRSEYGLTLIFVSRRSLDMIQGSVDCSTLAGLCEVNYLRPLFREGVNKLANRSPIPITVDGLDKLWENTGGHPFLAEVLMCEAVESCRGLVDGSVIDAALARQAHEFSNQYFLLKRLLTSDEMFEALCELVVGPRWRTIDFQVITAKKQYGLLRMEENSEFGANCLSGHLKEYLTHVMRTTPSWFIVGEAERRLRSFICSVMYEEFGPKWLSVCIESYPKISEIIDGLLFLKEKEKKLFGDSASEEILDYAYLSELWAIIFQDWGKYSSVLGGTKREWQTRFEGVVQVRNSLAHNRPVPPDRVDDAERSCKILLGKLGAS